MKKKIGTILLIAIIVIILVAGGYFVYANYMSKPAKNKYTTNDISKGFFGNLFNFGRTTQEVAEEPEEIIIEDFEIHYIDVGQGDCVLIKNGSHAVLIDTGIPEKGDFIVDYIKQKNVFAIDKVIITSLGNEHIGSLSYVVENFSVGELILPKTPESLLPVATVFVNNMAAAADKGVKTTYVAQSDSFTVGDVSFEILAPYKTSQFLNTSEYSMAFYIRYKDKTFLHLGDINATIEYELYQDDKLKKCDVLKVADHGANTATSSQLLASSNPDAAIISVGIINDYGLPHNDTLNLLKKNGTTIYRTDKQGHIVLQIINDQVTLKTEKGYLQIIKDNDTTW